ncbi:MAG: N-glycosylase/DNA lyase [Clostridiales bacterium]|nr:N-glycosylase/DNA lyase [Clostridiales bacterium]MDK2932521.1 N-glycosylase/DNA lyase [Clostridiales bacterium]
MKIFQSHNELVLEDIKDFNLQHTFECGQCFRWEREEDGSYTGIAYGKVVNLKINRDTLFIKNTNIDDFNNIWRTYFDLDRDYSTIKNRLSKDIILKQAVEFGWGIRILNQEIWECLISFIISSNNTIPRIKKIINNICEKYGQPIWFGGKVYYSFPRPQDLYNKTLKDLAFCRSGYRAKYILDGVQATVEKQVRLNSIKALDTLQARKELMKIKGVGPKVADCVLLFSGQKYDVFPTDVWIKRIIEYFYFDGKASIQDVRKFAHEKYGELAGFAQQYLFYYAREMKIGK